MDLILPSAEYKNSYIQYINELGDEERYPFPTKKKGHPQLFQKTSQDKFDGGASFY
ncbi:hypothetical protein ACUR5C_09970 [Aliikangiella sp. IMCC44653]